jgi:hypothetical protein
MSAESAADWFAAIVVGLMVGLVVGIGGWLIGSRWDAGPVGLFLGFSVGDIAGTLVFRALHKPE